MKEFPFKKEWKNKWNMIKNRKLDGASFDWYINNLGIIIFIYNDL